MMKFLRCLVYVLLIVVASSCQIRDVGLSAALVQGAELLPVIKIVDGDTFWVDNGTEKGLKIRFIGIDAPESRRMFKREIGYYGKEAKVYLTELLTDKKVKLVSDVDPLDQYSGLYHMYIFKMELL